MNRRTLSTSVVFALALVAGCSSHAQMPPTVHTVTLNWKATTSGGTAPYTYVMSRIAVTTGTSTCPAPNLNTPNYAALNSSSPASALTYVDTSAASLTVCYIVQALDASTPFQVSQPSNTAGPFVVPTVPTAPTQLGANVTASLDKPQPPLPKPSQDSAPIQVGSLRGRVN